MQSDLLHPDIVFADFKAHQRELWREADRQLRVRQAQLHTPQRDGPRRRERNAAVMSYRTEYVQEYRVGVPQRILVPFDWSAPAYQALEEALALAKPSSARLTLLYVLHLPPRAAASVAPYMAAIEDRIGQTLDALLRRIHDAGVEGRGLLERGVPWQKIVDVARAIRADLIVMGTHGRSRLLRLLLGSVAVSVRRRAPCPVRLSVETQALRVGQGDNTVEGPQLVKSNSFRIDATNVLAKFAK
jgi:nucleotide-binding universal stress UspA family protein